MPSLADHLLDARVIIKVIIHGTGELTLYKEELHRVSPLPLAFLNGFLCRLLLLPCPALSMLLQEHLPLV